MAGDRQEPGRYERQHNPLQAVMLNTWVAVLLLLVLGGVLSWRLWQTDWRNGALGVVGLVVALVIFGLFSRMQYRSLAKASSTSAGLIDSRDERLERMSLDLHAHEEMEEQVAKRTEELSRQKAFNELVLASIGEGLFGLDNHGNITLLNPAAEKIFGMPAADLIGKNLYTLAAEANTEETDPDWQENPLILAWKSGQAMRGVESVHKRPDGTTVPIETSTYPLWDHGELLGAVMTVQDITERKRAEEQHRLFELLVRNVTDYAILILDPEGHVKTWNKGAERVKGYKAEEIIGQSYTRFYPPDQLEHAHELLRIAAEKGHVEDEGWRLRKDGTRFWADVVFTAMHDEQGNLVGFAKITRDLTEKREAERAARLELERQAAQEQAERLHKLNVELAEVTARAQEANRLKSEFLANMSHELRTPLNSIIGYTELVLYNKKQPPTERQAKNLSVVLRNGKHLLGLINDILDISKVEAGKATLYPEVIDLRQLLQSVVSATAPLANEKGLKVSIEVDPILDTIISDETKLRQIVLNLISNALKFTREGGVTVTASPEGQNRLAIAVKDTGVGIAPENQELVFEEFRQIDSSTTREAGGTGLGLAISRKLARLLGGDLHLTSTPGVGSTFTLTLPRKVSPEQPHAEAAPPEPALRVTPLVAEGKLPVVVIDDDPEMLHLIAERLKDSPYEAVPASSGESGLQLARELHPYAITLDVMMPRMDGWMVLRELKRDRATSDIPVLILSFVENKVLGFSLGASAYLSKPIDQGELLDTLDRLGHPLRAGEGYVLVVDDDPDARGLYKQILEKENVRVVEAVDGRQAIEAIDREPPALVLLDLMMPHMDGFDVVSWIRNHGKTHDVPVIVVTAKELTPEDYQKLAEVRHVITKGETAERLVIEDLRDLLDHSHPRPPAEAPAEERKPTP